MPSAAQKLCLTSHQLCSSSSVLYNSHVCAVRSDVCPAVLVFSVIPSLLCGCSLVVCGGICEKSTLLFMSILDLCFFCSECLMKWGLLKGCQKQSKLKFFVFTVRGRLSEICICFFHRNKFCIFFLLCSHYIFSLFKNCIFLR